MADVFTPPRRRLRLSLQLDADSLADLRSTLEQIGVELTVEGEIGELEVDRTSGGTTSGYRLRLECDPRVTHDTFVAALRKWHDERRATDG